MAKVEHYGIGKSGGVNEKPRRKRIFVLLVVALCLLVPLIAAEIVVRVFFRYNTPDTIRSGSLQYEATVFARHMLKPNQTVRTVEAWGRAGNRKEVGLNYQINATGYRGKSIPTVKPDGVYRVIVLGGSAVFDIGANEGEDWPHLVEKKLEEMDHRGVELINAGVPGHSSADSLGRLYSHLWTLSPDMVLVYHAWNDIKYFGEVTLDRPLIWQVKPHDSRKDPFQTYQGFLDKILCTSQIYVKLRTRYLLWKFRPGLEGVTEESKNERVACNEAGFQQFKLNMALIVEAIRGMGATPVLLTQASLISSHNTSAERRKIRYEYQQLDHQGLVKAFERCNQIVRDVSRKKNVPMIDLSARLSGRGPLFEDHVHLTRLGAEEIAEEIARFLSERIPKIVEVSTPSPQSLLPCPPASVQISDDLHWTVLGGRCLGRSG